MIPAPAQNRKNYQKFGDMDGCCSFTGLALAKWVHSLNSTKTMSAFHISQIRH